MLVCKPPPPKKIKTQVHIKFKGSWVDARLSLHFYLMGDCYFFGVGRVKSPLDWSAERHHTNSLIIPFNDDEPGQSRLNRCGFIF